MSAFGGSTAGQGLDFVTELEIKAGYWVFPTIQLNISFQHKTCYQNLIFSSDGDPTHACGGLWTNLSDEVLHETVDGEDDVGVHAEHLPARVLIRVGVDVACM